MRRRKEEKVSRFAGVIRSVCVTVFTLYRQLAPWKTQHPPIAVLIRGVLRLSKHVEKVKIHFRTFLLLLRLLSVLSCGFSISC